MATVNSDLTINWGLLQSGTPNIEFWYPVDNPTNYVRSLLKKGQTVWWIDPDEPQNRTNWKISESWEGDYGDAIPEDDEIILIYTDEGSEAEVPLHEIRLRRHIPSYVGQTCNFCGRNKMHLKIVPLAFFVLG